MYFLRRSPNLLLPNAFNNMIPPFAKNMSADQNSRLEDTDFRIMGDLNNVNPMMGGMGMNEPTMGAGGDGAADKHKGGDSSSAADDETNFGRGGNSEYDRDRYRFNERGGSRNFDRDRERDRDRDRDKYHHERNHRFGGGGGGGGNRSPPYRENIFERGGGDAFRRGGRYESRDFGRGGRDLRGDNAGPRGRGGRDTGAGGRPRERSRERDYYRDGGGRRDYDEKPSSRRFERRGRSRERTPEERYGGGPKKSRWTTDNSGGGSSNSGQESSWASVPVPPAPLMAASSPPAMPAPPPAPVLTGGGDKSCAVVNIAPIVFTETWEESSSPPPEPSPLRRNPSPPLAGGSPAQSPAASADRLSEAHPIQTIQSIVAARAEAEERGWKGEFDERRAPPADQCDDMMAHEPPPAPELRPQRYELQAPSEFSVLQSLPPVKEPAAQSEYGDDAMDLVDQHEEQEPDDSGEPMIGDEAPVTHEYSTAPQMGSPESDGRVLSEIPSADEAPSVFE